MSDNPYASPTERSSHPASDGGTFDGMPPASQDKRFLNFIIDNVVTFVMSMVAGFVLAAVYIAVNGGRQITVEQEDSLSMAARLIGLLVALSYFFFMESIFGVTLGKLLTGTRVVSARGGKAGAGQILGRTFSRIIPFEAVTFLFGDKTTGLHDWLSSTRVVDIKA